MSPYYVTQAMSFSLDCVFQAPCLCSAVPKQHWVPLPSVWNLCTDPDVCTERQGYLRKNLLISAFVSTEDFSYISGFWKMTFGSQQVWLMTPGLPEITCTSQVRVAQFDITSLSSVDIRLFVTLYLFYLFLICVLIGCFCVWVDLERW